MMPEPKKAPTTAHILWLFAKELESEGFQPNQVDLLLGIALTDELKRTEGLMMDLDG